MPNDPWFVEVYTARYQKEPQTFSGSTETEVRTNVYNWLLSNHPTYLKSGKSTLWKEGQLWHLSNGTLPNRKQDEQVYRTFCDDYLNIQMDPKEQAKEQAKRKIANRVESAQSARGIAVLITIAFGICVSLTVFLGLCHDLAALAFIGVLIGIIGAATIVVIAVVTPVLNVYERETARRWYQWLKAYGVETVATVRNRKTEGSEDPDYFLEFVWLHPETGESHSIWRKTDSEGFSVCPIDSIHSILVDPHDPKSLQVYYLSKNGKHHEITSLINIIPSSDE